MAIVEFIDVCKFYKMGESFIKANNKVNFSINEGEFCVIVGPSGAGKTTILNLLGGMEVLDEGKIIVDTISIGDLSEKGLTNFRRYDIGFIFQFYNLIPSMTALENIEISSEICKNPMDSLTALRLVGLENRMNNFPSQLSGGEQQRVSIARAIAKNPKILLCDEPTGALDYNTGKEILKLLFNTCKTSKKTVVLITHNKAISKMANHIIYVKNGMIEKEEFVKNPLSIDKIEW